MDATVDLLVPELGVGDAISNHTRLMRELLVSKGVSVRIIVERELGPGDETIVAQRWHPTRSTVILQHGIGSQLAEIVIEQELPTILNYHNITPSKYVEYWYPELCHGVKWGREQLRKLIPSTRLAIADSKFNARELRQAGYEDVVVSPILWQMPASRGVDFLNRSCSTRGSDTVLFVGRITPNKCHHDLIAAFALLSRVRPRSRLVFIGEASPVLYQESLEALTDRLGLHNRVIFAGKVSDEDLHNWYQVSDIFVSASEHEGFGVPLVEAMANGLPVVAYDAAAISEIVGVAGIILNDKRPANLAVAIDRVISDRELRAVLRSRGMQSVQQFDIAVTRELMWAALRDHL